MIIRDPFTGQAVAVTSSKMLKTKSVSLTEAEAATDARESYFLSSESITLTNDAESGLFYFKSNSDRSYHIDGIVITSTGSAGGSATDNILFKFYDVPAGGTIVDNAVEGLVKNRNIGASPVIEADFFKGVQGDTITQSSNPIPSNIPTGGRVPIAVDFTISKGKSFALSLQPPSGNTSISVSIGVICHLSPVE